MAKEHPEFTVDKEIFEAEELSFTIVLFKYDNNKYKVEFVGDKPCLLSTELWIKLQDIIKLYYHSLNNPYDPKDEEDLIND